MSKTPRTDAKEWTVLSSYEPTVNVVLSSFARQLEAENAELRASLKECVEYAERYEDSGPFGEGWQSERLVKACQRARALLAKVNGE